MSNAEFSALSLHTKDWEHFPNANMQVSGPRTLRPSARRSIRTYRASESSSSRALTIYFRRVRATRLTAMRQRALMLLAAWTCSTADPAVVSGMMDNDGSGLIVASSTVPYGQATHWTATMEGVSSCMVADGVCCKMVDQRYNYFTFVAFLTGNVVAAYHAVQFGAMCLLAKARVNGTISDSQSRHVQANVTKSTTSNPIVRSPSQQSHVQENGSNQGSVTM